MIQGFEKSRWVLLGLWVVAVLSTACVKSGPMGLKTAYGDATELGPLKNFAVVDSEWSTDSAKEAPEQVDERGNVNPSYLTWLLRQRLIRALTQRGYQQTELDEADFALAIDAKHTAVRTGVQMNGTRSWLGTGNRTKDSTSEGRQLGVALDFVDLKGKRHAWRVTASGPPLKAEGVEGFVQSAESFVAQAPLQSSATRSTAAATPQVP